MRGQALITVIVLILCSILVSCYHYPYATTYMILNYNDLPRIEKASCLGKLLTGMWTTGNEPYDPMAMVAAHKRAKIKSFLKVTNPVNGKSVVLRVVDKVPESSECDLQISWRAGQFLNLLDEKIANVIVEPVEVSLVRQFGIASWYGKKWHGRLTASQEKYDMNALTAAHKFLPFNTRVKVTNLDTGKSVIVRINDRGPYVKGRIIDLSSAAAERLGMVDSGVANVMLEVLPDY